MAFAAVSFWSTLPFVKLLDERPHVFGQRGFEGMGRAGRIGEAEEGRVKGKPGEDGAFLLFLFAEFVIAFDRRE